MCQTAEKQNTWQIFFRLKTPLRNSGINTLCTIWLLIEKLSQWKGGPVLNAECEHPIYHNKQDLNVYSEQFNGN